PVGVGAAVQEGDHVDAVVEGHLAGEVLAGLPPPLLLLGPVAVAPGGLSRLETDHGDGGTVGGRSAGGTEPAGHLRGDGVAPAFHGGAQPVDIGDLPLDDLDEHGPSLLYRDVDLKSTLGAERAGGAQRY